MAARNSFAEKFSDFFTQCGLEGVITPDKPASSDSVSELKKQHLLTKNKSGLSWLMLCHNAMMLTQTQSEKEFYVEVFSLIMLNALSFENCFHELVELRDRQGETIFDRIGLEKESQCLLGSFLSLFLLGYAHRISSVNMPLLIFDESVRLLKRYQSKLLGCDILLLDNYAIPREQKGFHCGYYAIEYVTKFWNKRDSAHPTYPARLFGPEKITGDVSLKMLGKEAGMKGVGAIFDVKDFASILRKTRYQSQVVEFETEDKLRSLLMLSLEQQVPVIFPVDWGHGVISERKGKGAHYITLIGYVGGGDYQHVLFASHDNFHIVPVKTLFASNDNLQRVPATLFYKKRSETSGWKKNGVAITDLSPGYKYRLENEKELSGLRRKMVLVYPRVLEAKYKEIFSDNVISGFRHCASKK
jgi:hypothetical protein